ncbi:polysaccharide lyase family 8 super-sandwich domain-containing protein [Streptomyces sp. NPDC005805]|uniref:polysaccharide lyase family 8 super-sandwich domain-containing protein n=1 Tax=Streptomyces sp. NPDC005805 TaxID=3157068 RepID=UPI0033E23128
MNLSRRAVLYGLGAAVPAAALPAGPARAGGIPHPAEDVAHRTGDVPHRTVGTDAGPADRAALIANALALFAGTPASNARPETAARLAAVEATARARLAALDGAGPGELFRGLPLGTSDTNLSRSFQYLYEIALATRTPGPAPSELRGSRPVQRRVADGLARLHETWYGDQSAGYYGNWFTWEIGISSHLSRTLVLLREELAADRPGLAAACLASMDAYLRNGRDGDVDLDSRFHTGANLADITANRILQGAAADDHARIAKAVADQLTVYATIDPYALRHGVTDGFYADGSFVQHASVAYTGSYGKNLLTRAVQALRVLDGTVYSPGPDPARSVLRWVREGFAPVVFEGWMLETVKGRGVSRTTSGYADTAAVVEAVTDLSALVAPEDAAALTGWVKHVRATTHTPPDPAAFVSPVSIARYADLLASPVPAADLLPAAHHAAFNAMERTVHRRPGWAFALARSSERISKYEYMNGENLMPWFQGDGAHQLYLAGQDQSAAFGAGHCAVVEPHRLAGTTAPAEVRRTVPELYGGLWYENPAAGFTASSEAQNAYVYFPRGTTAHSGGARLGAYGAAALVLSDDAARAAADAGKLPDDFTTHRAARGTTSWFLLDEEVVVLAAGVGDPAGRAVTTTLDTRVSDPAAEVAVSGGLRDGGPWHFGGPRGGGAPAWVLWSDVTAGAAVGYVLLSGPPPAVSLETVTRSLRRVRLSNPDTPVTRRVFTLSLDRPPGAPPLSTAYALVPGATPRRLRAYAEGPLRVLANSTRTQALWHDRLALLGVNTFTAGPHRVRAPGTAGPGLTVDGPASVLVRRTPDGRLSLAVADPTTKRRTVRLVLHGRPLRAVSSDAGLTVRRIPGGTLVEARTHRVYGRSLTVVLRPDRF